MASARTMIYRHLKELRDQLAGSPRRVISVACAQDAPVIEAVKTAAAEGIAEFILVGQGEKIRALLDGFDQGVTIMEEEDDRQAALTAVRQLRQGRAHALMKGLVNSGTFLKAVLDPEEGIRTGRLLNHFAAYEVPGHDRLIYFADGGMIPAPTREEKAGILTNCLTALHHMGYEQPRVALLAANEMVNPKISATADAAALMEEYRAGKFPSCVMEGPIAMDVALSPAAAAHKGIQSRISGQTDLFLMPAIEVGNVTGKALSYFCGAKMAGAVLGAAYPIIMISRADDSEAKLNSIALACLAGGGA